MSTIRVSIEFVFKSKILIPSKIPKSITDNMINTANKIPIFPRAIKRSEEKVSCLTKPPHGSKKGQ